MITPHAKALTEGRKDFAEAISSSFEFVNSSGKEEVAEEECSRESSHSNSSGEMSYDVTSASYVLRIDTEDDGGIYKASCVTLSQSDEDSFDSLEESKDDISFVGTKELSSWTSEEKVTEVESRDRPDEPLLTDSISSNQASLVTNGFAQTNGLKTTMSSDDTDEALSTSSASEVDSLERDADASTKSVSETTAFFKSLQISVTDAKNADEREEVTNSASHPKKETVIEREIRMQKEREEALAEERRTARMTAFIKQQSPEIEGANVETNTEIIEDACDSELASTPDSGVSSEPFGPKRTVKVRPILENDDSDKMPLRATKESAVEREIRQALEREEELRREKGLMPTGKPETPTSPTPTTEWPINGHSVFPSIKSRTLDLLNPRSERSLQRKLATSRIQQEIEEYTQRELILRAEGVIKSTSEDYVDGFVLGRLNSHEDSEPALPSPSSLPSTPDSELTDQSIPSPEIARSSSNSSPVIANGQQNAKSFSTNVSNARRLFVKNPNGNGVLTRPNIKGMMQKFISSRGKVVPSFSNGSRSHSSGSFSSDGGDSIFERERLMDEIRAPVPRNVRRFCSAESKIQAELQQMKAREEELRLVRAKQMALSQPNLSNIGVDEDGKPDDAEDNHMDGIKGVIGRATSNPNLLDDSSIDSIDDPIFKPNVERRRSALIAQWEEKIMQQNNDN